MEQTRSLEVLTLFLTPVVAEEPAIRMRIMDPEEEYYDEEDEYIDEEHQSRRRTISCWSQSMSRGHPTCRPACAYGGR
jgi:hypothetical protein